MRSVYLSYECMPSVAQVRISDAFFIEASGLNHIPNMHIPTIGYAVSNYGLLHVTCTYM